MRYCPYFCEENIWHLCGDVDVTDATGAVVPLDERAAVFVSNAARQVRMRHQRAGGGGIVIWDYHVVMLARPGLVWDLDCVLGAPLAVDEWVRASFVDRDAARFRVVDAPTFVTTFASDRSHMAGSGQPAPPWPPIGGAPAGRGHGDGDGMNLMRFVDMTDPFVGDVVDAAGLLRRLR